MVSYFEDQAHARQVAGAIRKPALGALALALHLVYAPAALAQASLLSQGKPAFASSVQGGATPNLAVDGQLQSRWESVHQKDPQWLYVDLGKRASITKVVVQWENASARTFELQVSDDEVTWVKVDGVDDNKQLVNEFNLATEARYVRVHGTQRTTAYGYSIFELSVYGTGGDPGGGARPNIALHAPVRASSNESQQPGANPNLTPKDYLEANVNDDDRQTRWSSVYRDTEWVQVDLGSSQWIGAVELDWEDAYARAFDLQVANDGVNWRTVYRNLGGTGGVQNVPLYENGRYVRMQGIRRAGQYGYSLYEMRVYPWRDGDPKPVHTIPPVAQPSQVVVGKGSYEVDDATQLEPPPPQYRTEGVKWPIASNGWWQSLLISNLGNGSGLVTLPLRSKYTRNGLSLTTIDAGFVTGDRNSIETARQPDLCVMPESVAPDRMQTRVDGHGDYSVSVIMSDDASAKMRSRWCRVRPMCTTPSAPRPAGPAERLQHRAPVRQRRQHHPRWRHGNLRRRHDRHRTGQHRRSPEPADRDPLLWRVRTRRQPLPAHRRHHQDHPRRRPELPVAGDHAGGFRPVRVPAQRLRLRDRHPARTAIRASAARSAWPRGTASPRSTASTA